MSSEVAVLIPARNEPDIAATIKSVQDQTVDPGPIILVANNCSPGDMTAEIAKGMGCDVIVMDDNPHKKAGALNEGYAYLRKAYPDVRFVLQMDADTELSPEFLEKCLRVYSFYDTRYRYAGKKPLGALSCAFQAKDGLAKTLSQKAIMWPQAGEYYIYQDKAIRREISVVSGTANVFRFESLERVHYYRGAVWSVTALAEDYELTLLLKKLGYSCRKSKQLKAYTDLMPTIPMLIAQRTRWQRGTVDGLKEYGLTSFTWLEWFMQVLSGSMMVLQLGGYAMAGWFLTSEDVRPSYTLLVMACALFALGLTRAYHMREMGLFSMFLGLILLPEVLYQFVRYVWWTRGLLQSLLGKTATWT